MNWAAIQSKGMAKIALDPQNPVELRARMFSDLAQYVAPKRRAVDHSASEGTGNITISWLPAQPPGVPRAC